MRSNLYWLTTLMLLLPLFSFAQSDYMSKQSGEWTNPANWLVGEDDGFGNVSWVDATEYPNESDGADGTVTISSGDEMTISATLINLSDVYVTAGASVIVAQNSTVILVGGNSVGLNVEPAGFETGGRVIIRGILQLNPGSSIENSEPENFIVEGSGTYHHNLSTSRGTIPFATWEDGSTFLMTGYTSNTTAPLNLNQNYYNVKLDLAKLESGKMFNLGGHIKSVRKNFEIISSGAGIIITTTLSSEYSLNIGGDFIIGENAAVYLAYKQTNVVINVTGNLNLRSNKLVGFTDTAPFTLTLGGNLIVDGSGTYDLVRLLQSGTGTGRATIAVNGSTLLKNGSILKSSGTGAATLNLNDVEVDATSTSASASNVDFNVVGNWINIGGIFNGSNSTFNFNGSDQLITSNNQPFGNTKFASSGTKTLEDAATINGTLTIEPGTTLDQNGETLTVAGDWVNAGGTYRHAGGKVILNGAGPAVQNINSLEQAFYDIEFSNAGHKILQQDLVVDGDLVISTGATLDANDFDINLGGDWMSNGTYNSRETTLYLSGTTTQQNIGGNSPTTFYNLEISNPSVQVISDQSLKSTLTLGAGVQFDPDGTLSTPANFTLLSDNLLTANVAALPDGAAITGEMVVQRFMVDKGLVFRYVATPVTEKANGSKPTLTDLKGMPIDPAESSIPTIYTYDETVEGDVNTGWEAVPAGAALVVGNGYAVERAVGSTDVTLYVKGIVHQGDLNFPLTFTNSNFDDNIDDGWNLLGNPYPSSISWVSIYNKVKDNNNIDPTVWISDHSQDTENGYGYASFNAVEDVETGLNGGSEFIASGQGFWVNAIAPSPVLTISETDKVPNASVPFFRKARPKDVLVLSLSSEGLKDETAIIFREDASAGYDQKRDTYKLKNSFFNLSSLGANQEDLAYNFVPWFNCTSEIPLLLDNTAPGEYSFSTRQMDSFTRSVKFSLVDAYTGETVALGESSQYNFTVTADPKSFGKERFKVLAAYAPIQHEVVMKTEQACGSAEIKVVLENIQNEILYQPYLNGEAIGEAKSGEESTLDFSIPTALLDGKSATLSFKAFREGCEKVTLAQTATLDAAPIYKVTSVTSGVSCGQGSVTLKAEGAPEGGSYRWYTSESAEAPEATTQTNTYQTPLLEQTQAYYVSIISQNGCESKRVLVSAEVATVELPQISEQEGKLLASGAGSYQWFLDGEIVEGATASQLEPTQTGNYTVQLIQSNGCSQISDPYSFEVLGLEDLAKMGVKIWPNPTSGQLQISTTTNDVRGINISIYSIEGKLLITPISNVISANVTTIDLSTLRSGMYIVEVQEGSNKARVRIVKN
ncbi:T9SS type A sorting domain-containing protein [Cesiribacter sp. SM1]|uniref:Ig-like domain-containing protein n=1 Tax=Cesiribacter sp. SM1 TaxID=2861196 RepID=UPI001CD2AEBA|nr:T9SS type A sorting domain-containing protein [Cesiribacter sp. SM1]